MRRCSGRFLGAALTCRTTIPFSINLPGRDRGNRLAGHPLQCEFPRTRRASRILRGRAPPGRAVACRFDRDQKQRGSNSSSPRDADHDSGLASRITEWARTRRMSLRRCTPPGPADSNRRVICFGVTCCEALHAGMRRVRPHPFALMVRLVSSLWLLTGALSLAVASDRPNIIVILLDDLGYSDLGCYGGEIDTPNIDALAEGGVRFESFYNSARCCPSRASLMTGLYPPQTGVASFTTREPHPTRGSAYLGRLNDRCVTLGEVLGKAGYSCYYVGKWHLHDKTGPTSRGFEEFYGYALDHSHDQWDAAYYKRMPAGRKKEIDPPQESSTRPTSSVSTRWNSSNKDKSGTSHGSCSWGTRRRIFRSRHRLKARTSTSTGICAAGTSCARNATRA